MTTKSLTVLLSIVFSALAFQSIGKPALADVDNVLKHLNAITTVASTVPGNGDVNPYGLLRVSRSIGNLQEGHYLVSNFNNSGNMQGTGTTIVDVSPGGSLSVFAQINASALPGPCPGGVGLTTALAVLRTGWVVVGSLPTTDGTSSTAQAGCLIVLNSRGNAVETFSGLPINGPWDMTAFEQGDDASLFVTNVLNGTVAANGNVVNQGTVIRIDIEASEKHMPWIKSMKVIGSDFSERTDPAALVIGPTGVGLSPVCEGRDQDDCTTLFGRDRGPVLYVADTVNNRIAVIPDALTRMTSDGGGTTLTSGWNLNGPLGLAVSSSGHILTVNGDDGFITEITPRGAQIAKKQLDKSGGPPPGAGALFGLVVNPDGTIVFVDDASNTLNWLH